MTTTNEATIWCVTGPLATEGRKYKSAKAAYRAADRLDTQYGASRHFVTRGNSIELIGGQWVAL